MHLTRPMAVACLLICGLLTVAAAAPEVRVIQDRGSSVVLEFRLNGYDLEPININGEEYITVRIAGEPNRLQAGYPDLPMVSRSVIIPDDGVMDYRIQSVEYETRSVGRIAPSKGNLYRNIDPQSVPYTFDKIYSQAGWWPVQPVELDEPFILRDYRGMTVRFNPIQYDPLTKEIRVAKTIRVEVYKTASGGANVITKPHEGITREFADLYDEMFLNFGENRYDSLTERAGRLFIITADAYAGNMQTFKVWKRQKGIPTKMVTITQIGGNTVTNIKNAIQAEYNAGGLVWVLLVGDGNEVLPAVGTMGAASGASADPVYGYLAGGDYYPDAIIGRFSSNSGVALNIDKQTSRSINYEKTPTANTEWYHSGLGVASNQSGGSPSYADSTRMNFLRDSLRTPKYYYTHIDSSYDSWGTATMIKNFIETGVSIINYIGHGSQTAWSNGGGFSITDINNLNNPWKLPFVISVACVVGDFASAQCYCEASVTAGDVANPDGFIAHWGSSINQSWEPPCWGQAGAVGLLTHNMKNTFGAYCFNGAAYMIEHYGATATEGVEMAQTWHIFGDPTVQMRTNVPMSMTVNHAGSVNVGQTTFNVSVTGLANALVGLYVDTLLIGNGYTDGSGNVTVTMNPPPGAPGTMYVTVTAYNKIPYLGSVPIVSPSGPYVVMGRAVINDFGNGQVNPGDSIAYSVYAKNVGAAQAQGVYGKLSGGSYVTITRDSSWYGNIAVNDSAIGSPAYRFRVANNAPNGTSINFILRFHDYRDSIWTSNPGVMVYAPVLTYQSVAVTGGNGNGILDPGETANLVVTIRNEGGADAQNVTSTLMESSAYLTISDASGNYGTVTVGATANNSADPYTVTAAAGTPIGTVVPLQIQVVSGVYCDTLDFSLSIGRNMPTDTGYYYTYWSHGPYQQAPVYSWYAIDTTQTAHVGTSLGHSDDQTTTVTIPFTFRYYGVAYTQASICSNGWLALGSETVTSYINYGLPSTSAPAKAVFGVWDDLNPGATGPGDDYYYYDATNHRFVVEWFRTEHYGGGSTTQENFEILLYDPAYYPTPTNDGEIIIQYRNAMRETDNTVGIQNSGRTVGIQYYFDGAYHALGVPITDTFALKFTPIAPTVGVVEETNLSQLLATRRLVVYPTVSRSRVNIAYSMGSAAQFGGLKIYDISGRLVKSFVLSADPLVQTVVWNGDDESGRAVSAGVYFVKLTAGETEVVEKAVLLR